MNTFKRKKTYKTNKRLVFSILIITLTTFLINLFATITADILPKELSFLRVLFNESFRVWTIIILSIINICLGFIPLFHFFTIGGRKWIIKMFLPTIFYTLFKKHIKSLYRDNEKCNNLKNNWYRVTCYKYCDRKQNPLRFHYEFCRRRFRKKYQGRRLEYNKGYLICYYRYGMENGYIGEDYTSMIYEVTENGIIEDEEDVKGIAGMTFVSKEQMKISLNHNKINNIIEKIKKSAIEKDFSQFLDFKDLPVSMDGNVKRMKQTFEKVFNEEIVCTEQKLVVNFMKSTNTDYNSVFGISGGHHSNHFIGFKIPNENPNDKPWGVVVIDAYEEEPSSFWKIIYPKTKFNEDSEKLGQEWLSCLIDSYSVLLSSTISEIIFDKED